ncbi:MAG TPA: SAVED domain-containing protein [Humisphaera sp.]
MSKKARNKASDADKPAPRKRAALTDAKGMGGLNAQDGFDYQVWDALARLPAWLLNPAFEGVLVEGLEDVEARFFSPYAANHRFLDRFQSKSGELSRAELGDVVESFMQFEAAHPGAARVHTLVTPSLPSTLRWIASDPARVRKARPFYRPFPTVLGDSEDKLRADLVAEFGKEMGNFFTSSVDVSLRNFPGKEAAFLLFADLLEQAVPDPNRRPQATKAAFEALFALATTRRGSMLTRRDLVHALEVALGAPLGLTSKLPLHVRSDQVSPEEHAIEIDASRFCRGDLPVPPPKAWQEELLPPLAATAAWAKSLGRTRVTLSGQCRLSTAFAVGATFRSADGFDIEVPVRPEIWATDAHPPAGASVRCTSTEPAGLVAGRLIVAVGIIRDPTADVRKYHNLASAADILLIHFPDPLTSAIDAQLVAREVKGAVIRNKERLAATEAEVFFVGPPVAAAAIAHRWNAVLPAQFYEFEKPAQAYRPSIRVA